MAIREGRWDCSSCGSTGIYGRHVDCPGCGRPRPAGVRFYLTDDAPVITDPARLAEARAGADWICQHCEASNRATLTHCAGCGAERGTSPTQPVIRYAAGKEPRAPKRTSAGPSLFGPRRLAGGAAPAGRMRMRDYAGAGFLLACALVFGGWKIVQRMDRYPIIPAVVVEKHWTQTFYVQEPRTYDSAGWTPPQGAQVRGREQRLVRMDTTLGRYIRTFRQVPRVDTVQSGTRRVRREVAEQEQVGTETYECGQRDLGNGYFESEECEHPVFETVTRMRTVREPIYRVDTVMTEVEEDHPELRITPVYATWYTYRAQRWVAVDSVRMSGTGDGPASHPAPGPGRRLTVQQGERSVQFRDAHGEVHTEWLVPELFSQLHEGQRVAWRPRGSSRFRAGLFSADDLPACRRWHAGRGPQPPDSLGCSPRAAR